MSHTKGPWTASEHGDYGDYDGNSIVIRGDDLRIAAVLGYDTEETHANARLIAAAPELLETLENIACADTATWDADMRDEFRWWAQTRAKLAIAKAKGAKNGTD